MEYLSNSQEGLEKSKKYSKQVGNYDYIKK